MCCNRPLVVTVLVAAFLATAACAPRVWLGWLGLEGVGGPQEQVEANRATGLEQQLAAIDERSDGKAAVARRLLRGELTLFEAAAWFRFLNDNGPNPNDYRRWLPGNSDEEKLCRQVIQWVRAVRPVSDPEAEHRAGQLEQELNRHLAEYGRIVLPAPEALPEPLPEPE